MKRQTVTMLSAEDEAALLDAYLDHKDISARNKLVEAYMPLAIRAAEAFARRGSSTLQDLMQEAAIALTEAIEKFDRKAGTRLSTLARFYIKAALMRHAMDMAGPVRIGTNFSDKTVYTNLRRMVSEIEARTGAPITDAGRQEIADKLKVNMISIRRMEPRIFQNDVTIISSPSSEGGEEGRSQVGTEIAVEGEQGQVEIDMDQAMVMRIILDVVNNSYEGRDLEIVMARIGGEMTKAKYDRLVERHNITVERIRQIQRGALAIVRDRLKGFGINGIHEIAC